MNHVSGQDILELIDSLDGSIESGDIDIKTELSEQGLDSLDFMSLFFKMEETFQIDIPDGTDLQQSWNTVERIVKNINELIDAKG